MLGLKSFKTAEIVISGIELAEKIKKGQFKLGKLGGRRWPRDRYRNRSMKRPRPNLPQLTICTRA